MENFSVAILSVIKSLCTNLPVLKEWGYVFYKPLWLIVENKEWQHLGRYFANRFYYLDSMMSTKNLLERLTECSPWAVVMFYEPTHRETEFVQNLARITQMGQVAGKQLQVLPIIISEHMPICKNEQSSFFVINLEEELDWGMVLDDAVPLDEELIWVKELIIERNGECESSEERTLMAASYFLYPYLCRSGLGTDFELFADAVQEAVVIDENLHDTAGTSEAFIRVINDWHEKVKFSEVYELPDLELSATLNFDNVILFDEQFIYLKERLFKQIAKPLENVILINALKRQLVEDGVLCTDTTNTFTVKVSYCNLGGQFCRERMLRFNRNKLEVLGEEELISACLRRRDKKYVRAREI